MHEKMLQDWLLKIAGLRVVDFTAVNDFDISFCSSYINTHLSFDFTTSLPFTYT